MKKFLFGAGVVSLSLSLMSCVGGQIDMYQEGALNDERVQVQGQDFQDDISVADADEGYLKGLAAHYRKYGSGLMDVVVTYDARSYRNTAMKASEQAARISKVLRANGVNDLDVNILPIKGAGDESRIFVRYEGYTAHAPKGCDHLMPGADGDAVEYDPDYKLGCTIESMLARQVARPADLMGNGVQGQTTDGRAATNIVDLYRSGAPNEPLEGEQASGE